MIQSSRSLFRILAAGTAALGFAFLSGCATTGDPDPRDPLESLNRATFVFNDKVDQVILKPVAQAYNAVTPSPVRNCIGNFFGNASDFSTALNEILQGKGHDAASDVCRVAVNTTVGLLGCFDVASGAGLEKHVKQDFGLTLGHWGAPPGIYIVLPILGPSSVRDTAGTVVDFYTSPIGYIPNVPVRNSIQALRIVDTRASLLGAGELLEGASLDKYVFVRDGYYTRRRSQVYDGDPPPEDEPPAPESAPKGAPPAKPQTSSSAKPALPALWWGDEDDRCYAIRGESAGLAAR